LLTIKNGGHPQVLEVGVEDRVDGCQTLLGGVILPCVCTSQFKLNTIAVPRLKTFVVDPKLNAAVKKKETVTVGPQSTRSVYNIIFALDSGAAQTTKAR